MRYIRQLCCVSLLYLSRSAATANVHLQVEGLSGQLEKNVRVRLPAIENDEVTPDRRFRIRVDDTIREGLEALSCYQPTIGFDLRPPPRKGQQVLIAKVTLGVPVLTGDTDMVLRGGARTDKDYLKLLGTRLTTDTILNQSNYESFKKPLTSIALRKGYFSSKFTKARLDIMLGLHKVFWDIDCDSGERYRSGHMTFEGSQIHDEYLQDLVPFKKSDEYEPEDLAEPNRQLSVTGWLNSVVAAPQFDKARETKVLPSTSVVSPWTEDTIGTGIGCSADVGPCVKAIWKRPWMSSYGHSLITGTSIPVPEQTLDSSYKMPPLKNPLEQYYLVQGGFKRIDLDDTKSDSTTLVASRYWDLSGGWQHTINPRWSPDHFTQGEIINTTMLFCPGVMISRTRSHSGLMPTWGDSQRCFTDHSSTAWGSDVDFSVSQAQNVWIRALYDRHRFVTRDALSWVEVGDFDKVSLDLRPFAGGDRGIRDYRYRSVAPKCVNDDLKRASKLIIGSLKYQYNVTGK